MPVISHVQPSLSIMTLLSELCGGVAVEEPFSQSELVI